jgi:phospholipase/carboxylesterase
MSPDASSNPHGSATVLAAGPSPDDASGVLVLLHGRGDSAEGILGLAQALGRPDIALLAPRAARSSWWPERFIAPFAVNEPWLSSAVALVHRILGELLEAGVSERRIALAGFSQGACLAAEAAARRGGPLGGVIALAGGLVGPAGTEFTYEGDLDGTPVLIGVGDRDHHIPVSRAEESAAALSALGGVVDLRTYEGMGHQVNEDELEGARSLLWAT